jgi:hypothetical protein
VEGAGTCCLESEEEMSLIGLAKASWMGITGAGCVLAFAGMGRNISLVG